MDLSFISQGEQFEPVSAFMKGRAMRMAYESDKMQVQAAQATIDMARQRQQFDQQMEVVELARKDQEAKRIEAINRATALRDQLFAIEQSDDPVRDAQRYAQAAGGAINMTAQGISPESVRNTVATMRMRVERMAGLSPILPSGSDKSASGGFFSPRMLASGEIVYPRKDKAELVPTGQFGERSPEGYRVRAEGEGLVTDAKTRAKLNNDQRVAITNVAWSAKKAKERFRRIRDIIARGPETGWLVGKTRALLESDMQELRQLVNSEMLSRMRDARDAGIPFGQVTVAEWEMIARAGITLDNRKSANLRILDRLISDMDIGLRDAHDRMKNAGPAFALPPLDDDGQGNDDWEDDGNASVR